MDFTGNIAWITGAGTGIGKAVAEGFVAAGARVVLSSRDGRRLDSVAQELGSDVALVLPCDVTMAEEVAAAHQSIRNRVGEVDVLVNSAGATVFRSFLDSDIEDFDRLVATNLRGPFLCTKAVLPSMLERGKGSIVMISSIAAMELFTDSSVYSATKAGLKLLADCLRLEVRKSGVRVINVFPGATNTPIWPERVREKHGSKMMSSSDVASAILHACSAPEGVLYEQIMLQPTGGAL